MKAAKRHRFRLTPWQRRLLIGILIALTSQLHLSVWAEGFRISAAATLYPVLLITLMRDSHSPDTGPITALCVVSFRMWVDTLRGMELVPALLMEYPGGIFYICYDVLLCLFVQDRRSVSPSRLWMVFALCDFLSNLLNLTLSSHLSLDAITTQLFSIAGLAMIRSLPAAALLWSTRNYRQLLLREEHEQRYHKLFLMTAELKTELYFLKKDTEDIEAVMSHAYQLYEQLEKDHAPEEQIALALSIAREVHEVKKDNLRIIRGIEDEVADSYDHETMALSDLFHILETSTLQCLGAQRANIRLECQYREDLPIREHYRLLSLLKNLVTNAVEAIQAKQRRGEVLVDCWREGDFLLLQVLDDGPGIQPRGMKLLFKVGYSTKFNPETGNINRGVGLAAVLYIVNELDGTIQVSSTPGQGAKFQVRLPLSRVVGGEEA